MGEFIKEAGSKIGKKIEDGMKIIKSAQSSIKKVMGDVKSFKDKVDKTMDGINSIKKHVKLDNILHEEPPTTNDEIDQRSVDCTRNLKGLLSCSISNFVSWYNFILSELFLNIFVKLFLHDDFTSYLSFIIFFSSFLGRFVGSLMLPFISSKCGELNSASVYFYIMIFATLFIGLLPNYNDMYLSYIGLCILRFFQGFAIGGSFLNSIFINGQGRNIIYHNTVILSVLLGIISAICTYLFTISYFNEIDLLNWGWRLPFLLTIFVNVFLIYNLKYREIETLPKIKLKNELSKYKLHFLSVFLSSIFMSTTFYLLIAHTFFYSNIAFDNLMIGISVIILLFSYIITAILNRFSYIISVSSVLLSCLLMIPLSYCFFKNNTWTYFVMLTLSLLYLFSMMKNIISIFKDKICTPILPIAYNSAVMLFGSLSPIIFYLFYGIINNFFVFGAYLTFSAFVSLIGLLIQKKLMLE